MAGIARAERELAAGEAPRARSRSEFSVRPRQVAALVWLRWKLGLRVYRKSVSSIIGAVAMIIFVLLIGVSGALLTGAGYLYLPRVAAEQLLFAVLSVLYVAWAALPIVQYSVNEGLDVTRLATYPLTRAERMLGLTLATFFDPPTFIILALFTATLVGWATTPLTAVIGVVALALLYVHITGLSQMTVAALVGMLRSRRYRDLSVVIFAVMSVACSLSGQFATTLIRHVDSVDLLGRLDIGRYAQWTPPGMAAQAIVQANAGAPLSALVWIVALLALTPILLSVWAWTLDRGVTSPESAGSARASRSARARAVPARQAAGAGATDAAGVPSIASATHATRARRPFVSPVVLAVAGKDLRYLWRDPQIKASLLSSLVLLLVVFAPNLAHSDGPAPAPNFFTEAFAGATPLLAPLPALLIVLTLSMNALGMERQGLRTLLLFPTRALDIFWGKNLAVALVSLVAQVALITISCAMSHSWAMWPVAFGAGVAGMLTLLGVGNLTSSLLPLRVRSLAVGSSSVSSDNGCLRSVISLAALWGTLLTLIPVFILLVGPLLLLHRWWLVVSVPLAVLYGFSIYQTATRLIAPWFDRHASDIAARATKDE